MTIHTAFEEVAADVRAGLAAENEQRATDRCHPHGVAGTWRRRARRQREIRPFPRGDVVRVQVGEAI